MPLLRRLVALVSRGRLDEDLRAEIEHHLELRTQQLIASGMEPRAARAAARRAFGNWTSLHEEAREMWRFSAIDTLVLDTRYGVRMLRRSPMFAIATILSLAIGVGSTAAVFNVADAVLFRRLAIRDPQGLHEFRATLVLPGVTKILGGMSERDLEAMQRRVEFAAVAGFRVADDQRLGINDQQRTVTTEFVSANYFETLGVGAWRGRLLASGDTGHAPIPVVLTERLWLAAFESDAGAVGRTITLNGISAHVVGIARGFRGMIAERQADLFVPLAATQTVDPVVAATGVRLVVRPDQTVGRAEAEQRVATTYKAIYQHRGPAPPPLDAIHVSLHDASRGISDAREMLVRPMLFALLATGLLLLVACANTGGLLVTRFASRRGEFGIRAAIGAGRARIARQLVIETVLLASLAAVSGFVVAGWIGPLLMASIPLGSVPTDFDVRFDWRLLLFTSCISAAAAIIAAIAPVASLMRALRSDTAAILNAHVRSLVRSRRRANRLAIAAQVACALLLLVATASFARTLTNLARIDPGFDPADALAVAIDASGLGRDPKTLPAYYSTLHERLTTSPGIARVSFAQMGLMTRGSTTGAVDIAGWTPVSDADRMTRLFWVGPDFFETAGMRLVAGRSIGTIESAGRERVAVVNQEFARFYFGGPDRALGGTVNGDVRIIGVVADARYSTLRDQPTRAMFLPHTQAPPRTFTTFVIRPSADPSQAAATTMATIRAFDPRLKATLTPISELIAATMSRERFVATIAAVVSIFALFLSCAGLYAAVASSVAERRQEIALRLALGASPRDVVALVVKEPLHVTLLGISVAMPGIYVVMRSAEALLFGVPPFDIGLLTACTTMLAAVAVAATVWPARRALRIAPQESLKSV